MNTRNTIATATICVLSVTISDFVSPHQVNAESIEPEYIVEPEYIKECRRLVTGTYLTTTIFANFGSFRGVTTFNRDRNFVATDPIQSGLTNILSPSSSNTLGRWKCISDKEITATGLAFIYPTATLPASIIRGDFRATFNSADKTWEGTGTLRTFALNANPLKDDAPVVATFTVTGERIKLGQPKKQ